MKRPLDRLKSSANCLAELLSSEDGLRILHLLSEFDTNDSIDPDGSRRIPANEALESSAGRVGIWEPKLKNGEVCFTRARNSEPWGLWAQVGTIRIRPEARRVVLIGESVARGLFYDPHYNPAIALQAMLRSASGTDDIDVIDLARTGLQFKDLRDLTESAIALKPDVMVLLAGNNWHPLVGLDREDSREIANLLRRDGTWSKAKDYIEEKLRYRVNDFVAHLASLSHSHQLKVAIIVPEFNLLDWRENGKPAPLLDPLENEKWIAVREQARNAWAKSDLDSCHEFATELLHIDGGTSADGFSLLARVALRRGELIEAGRFLQSVKDAGAFLPQVGSPRCYSIVQESFRSEARCHGLTLIDLPKIFEEYLAGALPGREIFHDYCHFTAEGIRLAMGATAEAILPLLGKTARSWRELSDCTSSLPPKIMAEANLLGAVHNANWGQGFEIIHYHLLRALDYTPVMAEAMYLYADFHIRRAPLPLCQSFQRMAENLTLQSMTLFYVPPRARKSLNLQAVNAISRALEGIQPDLSLRLNELLKEQHGVMGGDVDLLERAYCSASYEKLEGNWPETAAYFRAYDNRSNFILICERPCPVELKLTYRTRSGASPGCLSVFVNGQLAASLTASEEWQTQTINVSANALIEGANQIWLEWPPPRWVKANKIAQIAEDLEEADFSQVYPVFGELHGLRATAVVGLRDQSPE